MFSFGFVNASSPDSMLCTNVDSSGTLRVDQQSEFRQGFTLIELLVVIAILGILASLFFPLLNQARLPALKTKCMNNLRQIQIACSNYADDHDSKYPVAVRDFGFPHEFKNFTNMFSGYLPASRNSIAFCPGPLHRIRNSSTPLYDSNYTTYQYFNMTNASLGTFKISMPKLSKSTTASPRAALWGCLTIKRPDGSALAHGEPGVNSPISGMNAAYVDGHAGWTAPEALEVFWSYNGDYHWPKPPSN